MTRLAALMLVALLALPLGGCPGLAAGALLGLNVTAGVTTVGANLLGIDVSLKQEDKTKTPIAEWWSGLWQ